MNRKTVLLTAIISALLASALNGLPVVSFASSVQPYPLSDVYARAQIVSPLDNGSYGGSLVTLNVTVYLCVFAYESNPSMIPYQDVTCFYSLDGDEWISVPFQFSAWKGVMPSHNMGRYYDQITCFYTVPVENLREELHSIRVAVNPEGLRFYYNQSDLEPSVNFTIKQSPTLTQLSLSESGRQQPESNYVIAAGAVTTMVAVTSLCLIITFKKRNKGQPT